MNSLKKKWVGSIQLVFVHYQTTQFDKKKIKIEMDKHSKVN